MQDVESMKDALGPLQEFIAKASAVERQIRAALPRKTILGDDDYSATTYPPSDTIITELSMAAHDLFTAHPAAKNILDVFFAEQERFGKEFLVAAAKFVRDHKSTFGRPVREHEKIDETAINAATQIIQLEYDGKIDYISDSEFKGWTREILRALNIEKSRLNIHRTPNPHQTSKAQSFFDELLTHTRQLDGTKCKAQTNFFEQLGVSAERPPETQGKVLGNGTKLLGGFQAESPATQLVKMLGSMRYLPMDNMQLLTHATRLVNHVRSQIPTRPASAAASGHTGRRASTSKPKPETSTPADAPSPPEHPTTEPAEMESMTAEEFVQNFADHPQVITALGNGTHVDQIAKERGVTIAR